MEPYSSYEHAGVIVEIVHDDESGCGPQENDNAGTIYSWSRAWDGDERISEPSMEIECDLCEGEGEIDMRQAVHPIEEARDCPKCEGSGSVATLSLPEWFRWHFDAVLTLPLYFADYGSSGARIYVSGDPNCAICFTQEDLDKEWSGSVDDATKYAEARINELDEWMQGNVFGIVVRHPETHEVLESVWGFIGEPDAEYITSEAKAMAEACAAEIEHEKQLVAEWAARDVVTVG